MNLSKSLMLSTILIATIIASPLSYANAKPSAKPSTSAITAAEKGSLATIAAIDKNEILVSIIAANNKISSGIADFAKMMIDQHGSNLTQIMQLANNLQALPLQGGEADKIAAQGKKEMLALGALQGDQFDKAYVNAMVSGHQAALNLIDQHLMKTAKSESVKKFLTETRAVVAQHLEHAKKLQAEMSA